MISARLSRLALGLTVAAVVSSCSMFSSSEPRQSAGQQEFDPMTNTWQPSTRVVAVQPGQPATPMTPASAAEPEKEGTLKKVGNTLKKPLKWRPFGKKAE